MRRRRSLSSAESVGAVISDLEALDAQLREAAEEAAKKDMWHSLQGLVTLHQTTGKVFLSWLQCNPCMISGGSTAVLSRMVIGFQDVLQPQRKFGFQGNLNKDTDPGEDQTKPKANAFSTSLSHSGGETGVVIKKKTEERIELSAQDILQKMQNALLSGLKKCIQGIPSTPCLTGLRECTLLTSVVVNTCSGDEFTMAS